MSIGIYDLSGAMRLTIAPGNTFVGRYAPDGSWYATYTTSGKTLPGLFAPDGSLYIRDVTNSSTPVGIYATDGSLNVTTNLSENSGAMRVVITGGGPTYLADFLLGTTSGVLPAGVSVSSPSLGGLVTDATGKLTYKPNNLLTYSNTFSNAAWTQSNVSLGATISGPNGLTGTLVVPNTTLAAHWIRQNITTAQNAMIWAVVKGDGTYNAASLANGPNNYVHFDLTNGSYSTLGTGWAAAGSQSLGSGWYLVWAVQQSSATFQYAYFFADNAFISTGNTGPSFAGNGTNGVYFAATGVSAVTYETTPRAADQVITTSSAYYGPAFDYDPVSVGTPLGLRVWESRTNLIYPSSPTSFGTSVGAGLWSAVAGGAWTPNAATGPQGTMTATKAVVTANTQEADTRTGGAAFGTNTYTASVWARANSPVTVNLQLGSAGIRWIGTTAMSLTTSWQKFTVTATGLSSDMGVPIIGVGFVASATFYFDLAQIEQAATAGPSIPTGSAAVTAAADVVTLTGTALGLVEASAGAAIVETARLPAATTNNNAILGTANGASLLYRDKNINVAATYNFRIAGQTYINSALTWTGTVRTGVSFDASSLSVAANGLTPVTGSGTLTASGAAYLGSTLGSSNFLNGYIRKLAIYNSRLPDATLQAKTIQGAAF